MLAKLLPLLVNLDLMLHIAWVLTPYVSERKIQYFASSLGHFIQRNQRGYWECALPF